MKVIVVYESHYGNTAAVAKAIVDVPYRELVSDKAGAIARLYEQWGLELTEEQADGLPQGTRESVEAAFRRLDARGVLAEADWPQGEKHVLVVGHQPTLGEVASVLLLGNEGDAIVLGPSSRGHLMVRMSLAAWVTKNR
jgi:hypothetical protein